jgi:acetoin utilization protein AcuA
VVPTERGDIELIVPVPPDLIRRLEVDAGFVSLVPSDQLLPVLLRIAENGQVALALKGRLLIGYTTAYPVGPVEWEGKVYHVRWERVPGTWEFGGIEVSENWLNLGIGRSLLKISFKDDAWEDRIAILFGFTWHWNLRATGLDKAGYRRMLKSLMETVGFVEYHTDEGNITFDPFNLFMARIGSRVEPDRVAAFKALLYTGELM